MNAQFKNTEGDEFLIGLTSLNFLDEKNVFDSFQEDHDVYSDIIFKTSGNKPTQLADVIKETVASDPMLREDLREKLNNLSEFIRNSKEIIMIIV